jgi:hypothetical protein
MGAALTFAQHYALFTPVGIGGEDDLDGSDLAVQTIEPSPQTSPPATKTGSNGRLPATTKALRGPKGGDGNNPEGPAVGRYRRLGHQGRSRRLDLRAWPMATLLAPADGDKVRLFTSSPRSNRHRMRATAEYDPPAGDPLAHRHRNAKMQDNQDLPTAFLQNRILAHVKSQRRINRFRILHGRPMGISSSRPKYRITPGASGTCLSDASR